METCVQTLISKILERHCHIQHRKKKYVTPGIAGYLGIASKVEEVKLQCGVPSRGNRQRWQWGQHWYSLVVFEPGSITVTRLTAAIVFLDVNAPMAEYIVYQSLENTLIRCTSASTGFLFNNFRKIKTKIHTGNFYILNKILKILLQLILIYEPCQCQL